MEGQDPAAEAAEQVAGLVELLVDPLEQLRCALVRIGQQTDDHLHHLVAAIVGGNEQRWRHERGRCRDDREPAPKEGDMSDATDRKLPVWRSALYVPSNVPRFILTSPFAIAILSVTGLSPTSTMRARPVESR